jgi:parvulin-like peptidyl-prolyl isomerase
MHSRIPSLAAAAVGLVLALSGALASRVDSPPDGDAAAIVNDVAVPRASLERARVRLAGDGGAESRDAVLARLVDEELLVQRALEIGLVDADAAVRKALVRAAIDAALREAADRAPSEDALRALHAASSALFARPRRVRVRAISFRDAPVSDTSERRAAEAVTAIAGGLAFGDAAERFGDRPGLPLPDDPLPEAALRRALGPTLADAALALPPGGVSTPVRAGGGVHLLTLVEEQPARPVPFDEVRERVAAEWRRREGEAALASLLSRLRAQARIVRAADAPRP